MKFQVSNKDVTGIVPPVHDIEVYNLEIIVNTEKPSIWQHWKAFLVVFFLGVLLSSTAFAWFYQQDIGKFGFEWESHRDMSVTLRSKDEQKGNCTGSDGS